MLTKVVVAVGIVSLPNVCPDPESILRPLRILRAAEWSGLSSFDVEDLWPQKLEQEGTCSNCVSLSSLAFFGESCAAASFLFSRKDGRSLRDLRIMVPAPSEEVAHEFAEQAIRVIGPPADSLVVGESDPWIRYYQWSSREDCGPHPEGCIVSTVEVGYRQFPNETFWTLIVDWTQFPLE